MRLSLDSTPRRMPERMSFLNSRSSVVRPKTGLASLPLVGVEKMFSSMVAK